MTSDWCTCTHHKAAHIDEPYKSCYAKDCQCAGFNSINVCDDCSHHPNLKDIQEQMQAKWREAWK